MNWKLIWLLLALICLVLEALGATEHFTPRVKFGYLGAACLVAYLMCL